MAPALRAVRSGARQPGAPRPEPARAAPTGRSARRWTSSARTASRSGRYLNDRNFDLLESWDAFARQHGHTLTELAFAWLLGQPEIASVIAGATRPEQVEQNVAAGAWKLSADEVDAVASKDILGGRARGSPP